MGDTEEKSVATRDYHPRGTPLRGHSPLSRHTMSGKQASAQRDLDAEALHVLTICRRLYRRVTEG
jgi:hypothetical protein